MNSDDATVRPRGTLTAAGARIGDLVDEIRDRSNRLPGIRSMRLLGRLVVAVLLGVALTGVAARSVLERLGGMDGLVQTAPVPPVKLGSLDARSVVYDRNGAEISVFHATEDREEVPLAQIPVFLRDGVIAVEDRQFWDHEGVNLRGTARALAADVAAGDTQQGGSTLTQQLIKNSITGNEQTLDRKVREAVLALRLEKQMTKEEILERYLNTVYLGHGAYGVQAASQTYFDKSVQDIQPAEAALLIALIRNPVGYDPIKFPKLALRRREVVIKVMRSEHLVNEDGAALMSLVPLPEAVTTRAEQIKSSQEVAGTNYFVEEAKRVLLSDPRLGFTAEERYDRVFKGGLRIYTTFDPAAQAAGEAAVARRLPNTGGRFTAALASVEPATGAIRVLVGGQNFDQNKFNYATQTFRGPGSSFKPFVLLTAMEQGHVPNDSISGYGPCAFYNPGDKTIYTSDNFDNSRGSNDTLLGQTVRSSNCAYLRLGQVVGLDKVADTAHKLGIDSDPRKLDTYKLDPANVSMPLGTKEASPLEMAAAYAGIANDGQFNAPYLIERVTDAQGKELFATQRAPVRASSPESARLVTSVLKQNVLGGTGTKAQLRGRDVAGKTGTNTEFTDAWFVGYTPQLATAVWMGNPLAAESMYIGGVGVTGGSYPAQIWQSFMSNYLDNQPVERFAAPPRTRGGKWIPYKNRYDSGCGVGVSTRSTTKKTYKVGCGDSSTSRSGSTSGSTTTTRRTTSTGSTRRRTTTRSTSSGSSSGRTATTAPAPTTSSGSTSGSTSSGSTSGSTSAGSTSGSTSAGSTSGSTSAGSTSGSTSNGSTSGSTG